jgi:hypothetical protein
MDLPIFRPWCRFFQSQWFHLNSIIMPASPEMQAQTHFFAEGHLVPRRKYILEALEVFTFRIMGIHEA